jgi:hypothetical protein
MLINLKLQYVPKLELKVTVTMKQKDVKPHQIVVTPWHNSIDKKIKLATLSSAWVPVFFSETDRELAMASCIRIRKTFQAAGYPKKIILQQWKAFVLTTLPRLYTKVELALDDVQRWIT